MSFQFSSSIAQITYQGLLSEHIAIRMDCLLCSIVTLRSVAFLRYVYSTWTVLSGQNRDGSTYQLG